MGLPVMLYGCEIWGHENLNIIEKLYLKSLKYILHLKRSRHKLMLFYKMVNELAQKHLTDCLLP